MVYHGRRAPNVSQYVANLNEIPTAQDLASETQETFNLEDDLAMFTNTQFFDFDLGQDADLQPATYDARGAVAGNSLDKLDFIDGDFTFPDFNAFTQPTTFGSDGLPILPLPNADLMYPASSSSKSPADGPLSPSVDKKRKADSIMDSQSPTDGLEESSRVAAEEDKRRRNTAASARFRVKKKQREQALERSAKEMSDKVSALEGKINQLEMENKWLKNLITEKNESKEEISALWKKYQQSGDRKASERKDGVGTEA